MAFRTAIDETQVASAIDRLALTLPAPAEPPPRDGVTYVEVASLVCELLAAGRASELTGFFATLEALHASALGNADSVALNEGLMESLIYQAEYAGITPKDLYRNLLPESRRSWEVHWEYIHEQAWTDR